MDLFHKIKQELLIFQLLLMILGFLTDSVKQLLKDSGYPGMKVLQFAFDSGKTVIIFHTIIIQTVLYTPVPMIMIRFKDGIKL